MLSSRGEVFVKSQLLDQMLQTTRETAARLRHQFKVFEVDTSGSDPDGPRRTAEHIAEIVLGLIEEQLEGGDSVPSG